jgi:acyl-CoA thioesterase I
MPRISVALLLLLLLSIVPARAEPLTLLALGDSLTAGLGLAASEAFPAQLEKALRAKGHDVVVINAGVSGDTALQGAERLDWVLTDDVDAVLVELGANDALRGLPVNQAEAALDQIIGKLAAKKLPTLLLGMKAPPNLGPEYGLEFDGAYPRLAKKHDVALYGFFLAGVAGNTALNQADGIHPTAEGVAIIVEKLLPEVEKLLKPRLP